MSGENDGRTWWETSSYEAVRYCGAGVSYSVGEFGEYDGDGECDWEGVVRVSVTTDGREQFAVWTCPHGHEHEDEIGA